MQNGGFMTRQIRIFEGLLVTFLLLGFLNLSLLKSPIDKKAFIFLGIIATLILVTSYILKRYYIKGDRLIFLLAAQLFSIGVVMIYRLNNQLATKQLIWFAISIVLFICITIIINGMSKLSKYEYIFMGLALTFMAMATFIGTEVFGSKNWVKIGSFSFQPSEFGKVFLILYLAAALSKYKSMRSLMIPGVAIAISLGFMVLQKDLGTALIIFAISVTMVYLASGKKMYVVLSLLLFIIGGTLSYYMFGHIRNRIKIWIDPWPYVYNESYQVVQSLYAMATGGFFGTGLGLGHPKYVAVNESDFIFAVICEEMGLLMGFAIIILHFLLFYRCIRSAIHAEDSFTRLLTVGLSVMLATQTIVIIGGVTGFIPLTGITLPFVSYGGTSLLISFVSLGIIQKVSEGDEIG